MHRRRVLLFLLPLLLGAQVRGEGTPQGNATDVALRFVLHLYSGVPMRQDEWLITESIASPTFQAHGGFAAMARQSTQFAHQYGGVSGIYVESLETTDGVTRMSVRVTFRDDELRRKSPALAEREDIVWRITARRIRGKWKLAFE